MFPAWALPSVVFSVILYKLFVQKLIPDILFIGLQIEFHYVALMLAIIFRSQIEENGFVLGSIYLFTQTAQHLE